MKKLIMIFAVSLSLNSIAAPQVKEYDQAEEIACYKEIKAMGCTNDAGEEKPDCVEKKLDRLSKPCQAMHQEKKKK